MKINNSFLKVPSPRIDHWCFEDTNHRILRPVRHGAVGAEAIKDGMLEAAEDGSKPNSVHFQSNRNSYVS
jgi:hypothetical protein